MSAKPTLYPENEPTPFWPLLHLSNETLEALFPYVRQAAEEDVAGGVVGDELTLLRSSIRAHLQHYKVYVDD